MIQYLVVGQSLDAYMMNAIKNKMDIIGGALDNEFKWEEIVLNS